MRPQSMRDSFFDKIYELVQHDNSIVIVSADLGAPSLDKFRSEFPRNFINVGIAEQNAVLLGSGLALAGKKPIVYGITEFIALRCYEQIRLYPCGMNLPVAIVGVGSGVGYWESGPTHHCIEDISALRALPNLQIFNCSDQIMADELADLCMLSPGPKFIRLDRDVIYNVHKSPVNYNNGYSIVKPLKEVNIIATGNMVSFALEATDECEVGIIDLFKLPVDAKKLMKELEGTRKLITLEESTLPGGIGSYIIELLNDFNMHIKVARMGFDTSNGYSGCYNYGGREAIRKEYNICKDSLIDIIKEI